MEVRTPRQISTVAHSLIRGFEPHSDHTPEGCLYLRSEVPLERLLKTCRRVLSTVPRCPGRRSPLFVVEPEADLICLRMLRLEFLADRPDEADKLPCNCRCHHLAFLASCHEAPVTTAKSHLGLPGDLSRCLREGAVAPHKPRADLGPEAIAPSCFKKVAANNLVASLGGSGSRRSSPAFRCGVRARCG